MQKTPQQFRRENVKQVFQKILKDKKANLEPISISACESLDDDFTTTEFSFEDTGGDRETLSLRSSGKGFVDGLFKGLYDHYVKQYPSLENIRLVDIAVNPLMKASRPGLLGSEAKASVVFRVNVEGHGIAEFEHQSRSMIYSSLIAALDAFQFYINCEKTFHKIQLILEDASQRNRGDIAQACISDLSKLTEVNNYAKKQS